jgi:hypothetical protein
MPSMIVLPLEARRHDRWQCDRRFDTDLQSPLRTGGDADRFVDDVSLDEVTGLAMELFRR